MTPTRRSLLAAALTLPAAPFLARLARAAAPVDVAGPDALEGAIRAAAPGTVLRLAPGEYGRLAMQGGGGTKGAPLTLTAADPAAPPRFDRMDLRQVAYLTLDGLDLEYRFARGDKLTLRPFTVLGATGLTLRRLRIDGDRPTGVSPVDDGFGTGFGLSLRDGTDLLVEDCEIADFFVGLHASRSRGVAVVGCNLHTLRMDGLKFTEIEGLRIEGNRIHDFNRSLDSQDHSDMIQIFTEGTTRPSRDVLIRNNLLSSGAGWFTQSIWMRNEVVSNGQAGPEMFYRNVTIEENVIANAHVNGIYVGEAAGVAIRRNTVIRNARSAGKRGRRGGPDQQNNLVLWTPIIRVAERSTDVTIEANVTGGIKADAGQPGWRVAGNVVVQDQSSIRPGYYGTVFDGDPADPDRLRYRKDGPLDGAGVGARRLQAD